MSWTLRIQRFMEHPSYTKYKVLAYRESVADKLPSEFQLDRKSIVSDFQRLLSDISGESYSFRPRSLQKFSDLAEDPLQSIRSIGTKIYSALDVNLKNAINDAENIHIMTDDLEMPWEIMGNGEEPICLKYSFGISPLIRRKELPIKLEKTRKLKVLFIVDTKDNLPQSRLETRSITSMLGDNKIKVKIAYDILEGKKATYSSVRNYIIKQNLDIVHVAAHAEFDGTNPSDSGIVVNDGCLRTKDIYDDVVTGPPWLVFMNACESAKTTDSSSLDKYGELSGLASAFLAAGALSYIGTSCRINDRAASKIAVSFYKKLLTGSSVGQSMQNARKEFYNDHRDDEDLSWLAFRLFGDPNLKRDLIAEAIKDLEERVKEYVDGKKKTRQSFTIIDLARDLNISVSEARRVLSCL
jgi:hypothetical protein